MTTSKSVPRLNDISWPFIHEFPFTMQFYANGVLLQTDFGTLGDGYNHNGPCFRMLEGIAFAYLAHRFPDTHIWRNPDYSRLQWIAADKDPWAHDRGRRGR